MKRLAILWILMMIVSVTWAQKTHHKRMSPQEFQTKQEAFITTQVGLTKEEAGAFFPLYFELQDRKRELNEGVWKMIRRLDKAEDVTEAEYEVSIERMYDMRISSDQLDKSYFEKFKKVLSCKKIFLVQKAEIRFHREMLKGMGGHGKPDGNKKAPQSR